MTIRERAINFLSRLRDAAGPLLQDETAHIALSLSGSDVRVIHAALVEFTAGDKDWQPIATLPDDREWDIRDDELSEDISLARAIDDDTPLFFLLQEKSDLGTYEHTRWRPALLWPKPPQQDAAEA